MPAYLLTHSLLSSWLYSLRENPYEDMETEKDAREEFMKVLRREPVEATEAMQNGVDFENLVTACIQGAGDRSNKWFDAASAVASELRGAQLQFVASKRVLIAGQEYVLYGRFDALKAGVISDIKFTKNYDKGKYYDSTQHPMYMFLMPTANEFTYIVSNGSGVWHETYTREETKDIFPIITAFLSWLEDAGLLELYRKHWVAK